MSKNFGDNERKIRELFKEGKEFVWNDIKYKVVLVGKPTCEKGEPKTDIYVQIENMNNNEIQELKISYKQSNADFLENKMNAERAEQLFGENWQQIITNSINSIKGKIQAKELIYKSNCNKTEKGSITLGWKFELLNVESGNFSGKMELTRNQLIDVYAGTNLSDDKKHAMVNGKRIENSGIAEYILVDSENINKLDDVINSLIKISDYVEIHSEIFFACKALNYRTFKKKFDGNRPLSVYVNWTISDGKLTSEIVFNNPLNVCGNEVAEKLIKALKILNVEDTDGLNERNILDLSKLYN